MMTVYISGKNPSCNEHFTTTKWFMSHGIPPKKPTNLQPSYSLSSRYWTQSIESNRQSHDGITGAAVNHHRGPGEGNVEWSTLLLAPGYTPGRFTYFEPHSHGDVMELWSGWFSGVQSWVKLRWTSCSFSGGVPDTNIMWMIWVQVVREMVSKLVKYVYIYIHKYFPVGSGQSIFLVEVGLLSLLWRKTGVQYSTQFFFQKHTPGRYPGTVFTQSFCLGVSFFVTGGHLGVS